MRASAVILLQLFMCISGVAAWEQTAGVRVGTATRQVYKFDRLERELITAAQKGDSAVLERMLDSGFTSTRAQGEPLGPQEWAGAMSAARAVSMENLSAREVGKDVCIVNFILSGRTADSSRAYFVVDVWQKKGTDWQLQARYQVPVKPISGDRKPTGRR